MRKDTAMCGITGYAKSRHSPIPLEEPEVLRRMTDALIHRGPDAFGYKLTGQVALGHRRLMILDKAGGRQPMTQADLGLTIVFNGEIYNYRQLNQELGALGYHAQTNSDTETILLAYAAWGKKCLNRFNGMFSFAIHDERSNSIFCARDRTGKKPFYFVHSGPFFAFASEVKALLRHPAVERSLDLDAAVRYFMFEHVPAPYCIFKNVTKLKAGHYLEFDLDSGDLRVESFWDHRIDPVADRLSLTGVADIEYWVDRIRHVLRNAVARRLIADVPVGVFLSGGLDSSAIVAVMAELMGGPQVKTFSIGFDDPSFDESAHSRYVAEVFQTDHHELKLKPEAILDSIPRLCGILDEPFADASIFPCYHLAAFARNEVTVALGGDGGDELFAGYSTFKAIKWARLYDRIVPGFVDRRVVRPLARMLPVRHRDFSFDFKVKQFLRGVKVRSEERLWRWLGAYSGEELYNLLSRETLHSIDLRGLYQPVREHYQRVANCDPVVRDCYLYSKTYLSDQILVKLDRSTMASSLEARCPLLDPEMIDLADSIPGKLKLFKGQLKFVLKSALQGLVPTQIISRPKKGFGMPVGSWLRGPLLEVLQDVLSPHRIREAGIFNPAFVQTLIDDHLSGRKDNKKPLWTLLMFEHWRRQWLCGSVAGAPSSRSGQPLLAESRFGGPSALAS